MEFLKSLVENWIPIVSLSVFVVCIVCSLVRWFSKPRAEQIEDLKEWLKYAVTEAEKELGNGTGSIKLRQVYSKTIVLFPWISVFVSFDQFTEYVKEALVWMENELETNAAIAAYVGRK